MPRLVLAFTVRMRKKGPHSLIRVFADCMFVLQLSGYPKKDKQEPLPYSLDAHADLSLC